MKEKIKNIVLFVVLGILMIVAIVIVLINPNKLEKKAKISNKQNENILGNYIEGNTISNKVNLTEEEKLSMQSGKIFCKIKDIIVFYEEYSKTIYSYNIKKSEISEVIKLENSIEKMYFDGQNIYYLPYYYSEEKGIYKVDLQGNKSKIYDTTSLQLYVTEDEIYFVNQIGFDDMNQNPQGTICKMKKDGTDVIQIADSIKNYFYINNDKIYYTTQDRKMCEINVDGTDKKEITRRKKIYI